ncbi:uncharacterized protein LOC126889456 [Diabrotica virgifera virgifera]|uniref:Uncharacterized protein n=1 Tax=Diabrotica virgifera virgifera TaxID=50390 RepID=A0ABM5KU60_DIAVI|nr:uncharacterized protein LOC126889456 [Diabrotica virgifera virgifera]
MQRYKISSETCSKNKNYLPDDEKYRQKIRKLKQQHVILEHKETTKNPKINFHDSLPFIVHKIPISPQCKKLENKDNVKSIFKKILQQNCSQSEEKKTTLLENVAVGTSKPIVDINTLLNDSNVFKNRSVVTMWNEAVKNKPNRDASNLVRVCAKHRRQYSQQSKERKEHKETHIGLTTIDLHDCKNQRSTQKSLQGENNSTQVSFIEKM